MPEFDFIVVGTGSAGSTLAARLTEKADVEVLALEAGGADIPPDVATPWMWWTLLGSAIDWGYTSVPQPALGGRITSEPRGKIPGGSSNLNVMMHIRGHRSDYDMPFDIIIGEGHPNSISILPGVVRPMSRGWIRLASADPLAKPLVNPNYLAARSDLDRLVQGVRLARDIFATSALSDWVKQELSPGPDVTTDAELEAFVMASAATYHHHAGSCKMGLDELAVVDPELRVYGIEGLRIADASVMPTLPSGNCHAGVVMIAERLADRLKEEYEL